MVDLVPLNVNGMPFRLISVHLWNWALALLSVILDLSASAVLHDPRRPQGKRWKLSTVQYKHHNTMLLTQLYHADQTIQLTIQEMTAEKCRARISEAWQCEGDNKELQLNPLKNCNHLSNSCSLECSFTFKRQAAGALFTQCTNCCLPWTVWLTVLTSQHAKSKAWISSC